MFNKALKEEFASMNGKRQRMRVLKTLNDKMLATFNLFQKEMGKKLDTDF